jgi:hypothetical protein
MLYADSDKRRDYQPEYRRTRRAGRAAGKVRALRDPINRLGDSNQRDLTSG